MSTLSERLTAAIHASGKSGRTIADEAGTTPENLSKIAKGHNLNPGSQLLAAIARAIGVSVGSLYGESLQFSAEDEETLLRFRGWVDEKLATIDARKEPNAILLSPIRVVTGKREMDRVADHATRKAPGQPDIPTQFKRPGEQFVLRAIGDSMTGAGILANDTLFTAPHDATLSAIGKIVACRVSGAIFVKRLVSEHRRLFLLSANPRYAPIEIDEKADRFEILGIVIGRVGAID